MLQVLIEKPHGISISQLEDLESNTDFFSNIVLILVLKRTRGILTFVGESDFQVLCGRVRLSSANLLNYHRRNSSVDG